MYIAFHDEAVTDKDTKNMEQPSRAGTFETDDESDVLVYINDLFAKTTKSDYSENFDTDAMASFPLKTLLESLGRTKLNAEIDILPKENLSFCLGHICVCMYQVRMFYKHLGDPDRGVLALATLRAQELSRYLIESDKRNDVSSEEQSALKSIETKLFGLYEKYVCRLLKPLEITFLERLYMTRLGQCEAGKLCFFNNAVPLPLVAFLVKRELRNFTFMNESNARARSLCLYTLCHSDGPLAYYTPTGHTGTYSVYCDLYRHWLNSFESIVAVFLKHLKNFRGRNSYLKPLFKYYSSLNDGKAMFYLWDGIRSFHLETISEDALIALLEFLLHCLEFNNSTDQTFELVYKEDFRTAIEFLCDKLGPKFIGHALENLRDFEKFNSAWLLYLLDDLKIPMPTETPMSDDMVRFVIRYFSGYWEHTAEVSCIVLNLFEEGDKRLGNVFDAILNNAAKFTTEALLSIAEVNMEYQLNAIDSKTGELFTEFAEKAIKLALTRIEQENTSVPTRISRYCDMDNNFSIFSSKPDPRIQWVFQGFLTRPERAVTACRQFTNTIREVREAFNNDLSTILSLFVCVKKHKPLLEIVKLLCGDILIQLVRKSVLEATDSLTTTHYKAFTEDLDKVQKYFDSYIADENKAFKDLLLDIKRRNRSKKQLIKAIKKKLK